MNTSYQYIIIGAGCAGLQLAKALLLLPKNVVSSVLIIESNRVHTQKSWCFWEKTSNEYDHLVKKIWKNVKFISDEITIEEPLQNLSYQYIDSLSFYKFCMAEFKKDKRITVLYDNVITINEDIETCNVVCKNNNIIGNHVFNSLTHLSKSLNEKPKIWQHFLGWEIETENDIFDVDSVTLMDFAVDHNIDGRFMYILPFTPRKALIECTVFSNEVYDITNYEISLTNYIEKKLKCSFALKATEKGIIPMQIIKQKHKKNSKIIDIGTAAGCIKASTGYSFSRNMSHTKSIVEYVKNQNNGPLFNIKPKYFFYDKLLLWIINHNPIQIKPIFSQLFRSNKINTILKFLDEKTTLWQEIKIFFTLPKAPFLLALFKIKINA